MQDEGHASEFLPTDHRCDDALILELKVIAQSESGLDVTLHLQNRSEHRLIIPELFLSDLRVGHVPSVRIAEWGTDILYSSFGGESMLEPDELKTWDWIVRSSRWCDRFRNTVERPPEYVRWDTQGRLSVDLNSGEYVAWYELTVDEQYFNPHSHARLKHLRWLAHEEHAFVWIGTAKSNRVHFHYQDPVRPPGVIPSN